MNKTSTRPLLHIPLGSRCITLCAFFLCFLINMTSLPAYANETPLPANQIFQLTTTMLDANSFSLRWQIKPGFYLYRERIHLTLNNNETVNLGHIQFPEGIKKNDPDLGHYQVYENTLSLTVPIAIQLSGEILAAVHYQGCAKDGYCYPPQDQTIKLAFNEQHALIDASIEKDIPSSLQHPTTIPSSAGSADPYSRSAAVGTSSSMQTPASPDATTTPVLQSTAHINAANPSTRSIETMVSVYLAALTIQTRAIVPSALSYLNLVLPRKPYYFMVIRR